MFLPQSHETDGTLQLRTENTGVSVSCGKHSNECDMFLTRDRQNGGLVLVNAGQGREALVCNVTGCCSSSEPLENGVGGQG